jgi:hypothetical protein
MKFLQNNEKITNIVPFNAGKDLLCFLILSLNITGLEGINHMDQLSCCIFGMILFVLILHLSHLFFKM